MNAYTIRRGDIFYVDRFEGQCGSEQYSGRPGVIVSNDVNNESSETVEVVYLTTRPKKKLPTHVKILSTGRESTVLCEQVTTVSVERLGTYIGSCTEEELREISHAIVISLALLDCIPKPTEPEEIPDDLPPTVIDTLSLSRIESERDTYKRMYEALIDRLLGSRVAGGVGE